MHVEKGAKAVHYESGPDMTPLVDVVMVLLIFLMMAGKFGGMTRYLISDVGVVSSSGAPPVLKPDEPPKTEVTLNVTQPAEDQFRAFYAQSVNANSQEQLASELKKVLDGYIAGGKKVDDIQLFIKPATNVRYDHVVRVYSGAIQAGFTKIGFHTSE